MPSNAQLLNHLLAFTTPRHRASHTHTRAPRMAFLEAPHRHDHDDHEHGADCSPHVSSIWNAAREGDSARIERIIDRFVAGWITRANKAVAVTDGSGDAAHDRRGDIDARDAADLTALHYACRANHLNTVRTLLQLRANVDAATVGGSTALHRAAYCGNHEVAQGTCAL